MARKREGREEEGKKQKKGRKLEYISMLLPGKQMSQEFHLLQPVGGSLHLAEREATTVIRKIM